VLQADRFLGFVVHEYGIQINPKKVESIKGLEEPTCEKDVQKLLGKINYLRRFISNLVDKIELFLLLIRLKHELEFVWGGATQKRLLKGSRTIWLCHRFCERQGWEKRSKCMSLLKSAL
jgi:hypothetical protein